MNTKRIKRKEHTLRTAYHEIGHYLLIKKMSKDFKGVYKIEAKHIELCKNHCDRVGGKVCFMESSFICRPNCNQIIKVYEGILSMTLAGFAALKVCFNTSVSKKLAIKSHNDYVQACCYARLLSKWYKHFNICNKSPKQILKENLNKAIIYLSKRRNLLDKIAPVLAKEKFFSRETLDLIDAKYSL